MPSAGDRGPMSLLPSDPDISPDGEPRVVGLDGEEADVLLDALSSEKGRRLFLAVKEEPAPPGELADRLGVSLQNTQYHLNKLEDAGVIEVVDTAYSEKGRQMDVYGPADDPLVIFVGERDESSGLRAALSRLFAGWLAVGLGAVVIQELFGRSILAPSFPDTTDPPAGTSTATSTPEAATTPTGEVTPTPAPEATPTVLAGDDANTTGETGGDATATAVDAGVDAAETVTPTPNGTATPTPNVVTPSPGSGVRTGELFDGLFATGMPPGLAFFLGGSLVLTALVAMVYVQQR